MNVRRVLLVIVIFAAVLVSLLLNFRTGGMSADTDSDESEWVSNGMRDP